MAATDSSQKSYFELSEHNSPQIFVFFLLISGFTVILFAFLLSEMTDFFTNFLNGRVFNEGEMVSAVIDSPGPKKQTHYLFYWAVDIYVKTPEEARYWFNPALSLFAPLLLISIGISIVLTSLIPRSMGYMRQKIEREIANALDKISLAKYGMHTDTGYKEIVDDIMHADLRDLHDFVELWHTPIEDLKILQRALKWYDGSTFYKLIHLNDGLHIYMRSYFTVKYNNTVLGFVYIGAAVLIIIIGLRGLKFIPPTQPSLVLFALGLEFSLLITYAFSLMYSKQEEEAEAESKTNQNSGLILMSDDYGNSKEIESLLRVFIKKRGRKKK